MNIELVVAAISALVGASVPFIQELTKIFVRLRPQLFESEVAKRVLELLGVAVPVKDEASALLARLSKASAEMDGIITEIGRITAQRQKKIMDLEADLTHLSDREKEIKQRIESLQKVPVAAAEYLTRYIERSERKSATRDYTLFLLGVVVTVVVTVVLKRLGWA